jgi:colanic acid/amylovoran biosynthesis glycosyltransferase
MKWIPDFKSHFLIKSFQENKINGVLAEYSPTGVAALPICKQLKLPLFVHFHGYDDVIYETLVKFTEGQMITGLYVIVKK